MLSLAANLPAYCRQRWWRPLSEAVTALAWDAHGGLWSACADGSVRRHDAGGTERRAWAAHDGGVTRLCLQPRSARLATAGEDGRVCLWGDDGVLEDTLIEESGWVEHLAWTIDGRLLAAAAGPCIHLWRDGESLGVWYQAGRTVLSLAWAPDGKRLASAANKGLDLWRVGGQTPVQLLRFPGAPVALEWRPDGRALAVGTQDGFLQVWRQSGAAGPGASRHGGQLTMRGYPAKVTCLAWHPKHARVATAGGPDVVIWDLGGTGGGRPLPLRMHRTAVTALAYSPSGDTLVSAARDGQVCLWSYAGAALQSLVMDAEVSCAAWSADGGALALGCTDGRIEVLEPITADPSAAA